MQVNEIIIVVLLKLSWTAVLKIAYLHTACLEPGKKGGETKTLRRALSAGYDSTMIIGNHMS